MAITSPETALFDTVSSIRKTVNNMQLAENIRASDRALIDTLANGERPYSPEEVEKHQIRYNINWGGMKRIIGDANRQVNGATIFKPTLFTATSRGGDIEKRDEYGQKLTTNINERLMRGETGKTHTYLLLSRNASVCLHGSGVIYFPNDYSPIGKFAPLENVLIPTDTMMDFSDLSYFDIKVELTPFALWEMAHGDKVDQRWDMGQVDAILLGLKDLQGLNPNNYNWVEYPEKMQEIFKQNRCFLNSDSVAKVKLDYFFSKETETGKWFLKIFLRDGIGEADSDKFVYQSNNPFADNINQILQVQYGDTSVVPTLKFHSVRGLGNSLYSASNALNRFTSGLFQHGEEQLRAYLRIQGGVDKGRENVVTLEQYGILEDGVSFVPEDERHQVDAGLVESIMSICRQNQSENSTSFVQDINDGTKKEMTLGEAQIRHQSDNVQVSSMLKMMYCNETFYYEEVVRRYLKENSGDKEVESFRAQCIKDGIPKELLIASNWRIEPERVLGSGDQTLALQEVGALFQNRQSFDPKSQRIIDRMFVSTVTRDPAKGMLIVPDVKDDSSSGVQVAEDVFGTLMTGTPVSLRQGIPQNDYIEAMLRMMGQIVQRISQGDNMGTMQDVIGLSTVAQDVQQHIQIIESDRNQAQNVKMYGDALGKIMNLVKAFGQRIQESQPKQAPKLIESMAYKDVPDDVKRQIEAQAGLQPSQMQTPDPKAQKAQLGLAITQAKFDQKTAHTQIAFEMEQIMKLTAHQTDLSIEQQKANQELVHNHVQKLQELMLAAQQPQETQSPSQTA